MAKAKLLPKGTWFNKDDGRYYKKCPNSLQNPDCDVEHSFSRRDGLIRAIKRGSLCRGCGYRKPRKIKPLPEGAYYDETIDSGKRIIEYYKFCPNCGNRQPYKERRHLLEGLENDYFCKTCSNKQISINRSVLYKDTFRVGWYKDFIIGAKKRNHKWELDMEDVYQQIKFQDGKCMYTGMKLTFAIDTPKRDATASIDRLNSDDHYHKDNICICLKKVNMMKQSLTLNEFIHYCKLVAKTHV